MAPTPKPPGQRRRRNKGQADWNELPLEGRKGRAPKPRTERGLGDIAMEYWRTIWSSPMAVTFVDADIQSLTRLVVLVDDRARAESADGLIEIVESRDGSEVEVIVGTFQGDAEIRQLEDRYGLSPLARRRLQWEISQSASADVVPIAKSGRRLRAVEAG